MNFRCLGDAVDPEPYLLREHYNNPEIEIANLKRLLRDKNSKYTKLKQTNDELRRENDELKTQKHTFENRHNSLQSEFHKLANQARIKITELHNETQHIQECYNKLKMEHNQLKTIVKQKDNTIKVLLPYREQCKCLIIKLDEMNTIYKKNEELYKKQIIIYKNQAKDEEKQIVKLPTIQETLWKYNDIRDETYTQTVNILKTFIIRNNKLDLENNKWYVNQVSHEIMFNVLIQSYISTKIYIENKQKQFNINNYLNDMKINIIKQLKDNCNDYNHKMIALNVFNLDLNSNEIIEIIKYINKCLSICWIMVLRDLKFYPSFWRDNNQFNQTIHTRVFGSNIKCQKILYNVWPVIINNNDNIIDNQKIDVVTQTDLYKPK